MKIVVNRCYGGFSLSKEAAAWIGLKWDGYGFFDYEQNKRSDPKLVACVKALGKKANGRNANLKIIEIPDGISWYIDEYDGYECVREFGHCWPKFDESFWEDFIKTQNQTTLEEQSNE